MYAIVLVLLSISVCDLQALANICVHELALIEMNINCSESAVSEFETDILKLCIRYM